jgi:hypothetical protein
MQLFKKIADWLTRTFQRKYQSDLDQWISARHPQNAADVDMLIKQYQDTMSRNWI